MNLTNEMKGVINAILESREKLKAGRDKEGNRVTNPHLMIECIKEKEQLLGKMIADHFTLQNSSRFVIDE